MALFQAPLPVIRDLLAPLLSALPAAAVSSQPAPAILSILSPILRQRVQLLSGSEPWLKFLCYDSDKVARLGDSVRSHHLEPHPVSGEIEMDWDDDAEIRYRRLDNETLQALVALKTIDLVFQLVYCIGDPEGGDGWRVGQVSVSDKPFPFSIWGGTSSLANAEADFREREATEKMAAVNGAGWAPAPDPEDVEDEEDDDDYWARYDATPARTPAAKRSPAPTSVKEQTLPVRSNGADDAYFAQYDTVQPAMDNHDPDEAEAAVAAGIETSVPEYPSTAPERLQSALAAAQAESLAAPPLGLAKISRDGQGAESADSEDMNRVWTMVEKETRKASGNEDRVVDLVHPRPESASSACSTGSQMVAKLESAAAKREQSEFGIKQHISRTVRSLFALSRAAGIDREEFDRLVKTELDLLGIMEAQEHI